MFSHNSAWKSSARLAVVSLFLASFTGAGCASGPELEKYPRTQIDRPYTLPKGVATWDIPAIILFSKDSSGYTTFIPPIPIPLFWQTSLSDDWQLSWLPLPLLVSHQFSYDDSGYFGGFFGLGGGYGSVSGVLLAPLIGAKYRRKLTTTFALETQASFNPKFQFSDGPYSWSADLQIWAFFQVSPLVALSAGPDVHFGNMATYTTEFYSGVTSSQTNFQTTVPLSANFYWSFHRQWDLNLGYRLGLIGESNGAYSHLGTIEFIHFW